MMRLKHGPSFTLRSLFSRRTKRRSKKTNKRSSIPAPVETGLPRNDSAPTATVARPATRTTRCTTSASNKSALPLEKELQILGLHSDPRPRKSSPIELRLASRSASSLPAAERKCMLNQAIPGGPMIVLPVVQHAHTFLDMSGGVARRGEGERGGKETPLPSPLLPPRPPPCRPRSRLSDPPISPSPSRLTSTTRSSATLPWWGIESPMQDNNASFVDSLSDDHILVLPSPPSVARFSAHVR